MNWRTDIENAPHDRDILVYSKDTGARVVIWDFNNCGYSVPWQTWCVVDTGNTETIGWPTHWCEIIYPH